MSTTPFPFTGAIPDHYERHLVPVIFAPYAEDLVARVPDREGLALLEIACGTGVVTRLLPGRLPAAARIVATDLHQEMLDVARPRVPEDPRLTWRTADGMALPFGDGEFDCVLCQFGVMFYPGKLAGMRAARRVLRADGRFLFTVMDSWEHNPFGRISHETLASFFPSDAPKFYLAPFSWSDTATIAHTLREAGFSGVKIEKVAKELRGPSLRDFATGLVRGNPVIEQIGERGLDTERVIDAVAENLRPVYGDGPFCGPVQALVVTAEV